jgi:ferredoxin-NADP reductase
MPQPVRLSAVVDEVIHHVDGLRSLVLRPERPVPRFTPGQFLHLAIDAYDPSSHWPDSRIFSIASSPDERSRLRITFSAVGVFTRRMLGLTRGAGVWLKLPYGEFVVEASPTAPAVLVAGGTGITPFVSLLAGSTPPAGPVHVLYGGRTVQHLIYQDVVERATRTWAQVRATFFVEQGESCGATVGRLSTDEVIRAAQALGEGERAVFFLSGPPAMLRSFRAELGERGVAPERIRIDAWGD